MNTKTSYFHLLGLTLLLTSCIAEKPKEELPKVYTDTDIQFLGHKGSGNNIYNDVFMQQSLPSIENAVKKLDGVEVDVQMSKDGTLWLYHNSDFINDCDTTDVRALILRTDDEITQIKLCHKTKTGRIYKLKELIDFWNATDNGFYISLEIKTAFPTDTFDLVGGKQVYLQHVAQGLIEELKIQNHPNQILVEVNYQPLCTEVRKYIPGITFCLYTDEDMIPKIQRALDLGYDGISCNYNDLSVTTETIQLAHDSGLVVQLWTPYYLSELISAMNRKPNFIQTDNVDAKDELLVR